MLTKATLILFDTRGMETSRFVCAHISTDANRFRTSPFLNSGIVHACVPLVFFKPINAPTDLPPPPPTFPSKKKKPEKAELPSNVSRPKHPLYFLSSSPGLMLPL